MLATGTKSAAGADDSRGTAEADPAKYSLSKRGSILLHKANTFVRPKKPEPRAPKAKKAARSRRRRHDPPPDAASASHSLELPEHNLPPDSASGASSPGSLREPYAGKIRHPSADTTPVKPPPPPLPSQRSPLPKGLSPRKQSIMRYQRSDDGLNSMHNHKDKLKTTVPHDEALAAQPPTLNTDDKVSLFTCPSSRILVYDEQATNAVGRDAPTSGRLLGHGALEVFQLHNGDVTYLLCGTSFVYPLLPKLKILRVGANTFVLPLVNPERYWKILVVDDNSAVERLEHVLGLCVKYRSLYFRESKEGSPSASEHGEQAQRNSLLPATPPLAPASDAQPTLGEPRTVASEDPSQTAPWQDESHSVPLFSSTIPESPPSAPLSPHRPLGLDRSTFSVLDRPLDHHGSEDSFTTDVACLDVTSGSSPPKVSGAWPSELHHPQPVQTHLNPFHVLEEPQTNADNASDTSMDSLIDEYEENISVTKPYAPGGSRPPSVAFSRASTLHGVAAPIYRRPSLFQGKIERDDETDDGRVEEFPSTSLSEYNRVHNGGASAASRRLSRAEVDGKLVRSRSLYSVASTSRGAPLSTSQQFNSAYRNIYRSITERNLAQNLDVESCSARSHQSARPARHPPVLRSAFTPVPIYTGVHTRYANSVVSERPGVSNRQGYRHTVYGSGQSVSGRSASSQVSGRSVSAATGLVASDVYNMLGRNRASNPEPKPPQSTGLASRFFGW